MPPLPSRPCLILLLGALALWPTATFAQDAIPGMLVALPLSNGDVLHGELIESTDYVVTIQHPILGWVTLPRTSLALPEDVALTAANLAAPPAPPPAATPAPSAAPSPWSGSFDVGLNGSTGNSDEKKLRAELKLRHEDDEGTWDSGLLFNRNESNGDTTDDQRFLEARHTWKLPDSKWGPFAQGSFEDDRFKDFDSRVSLGGGVAYTHRDDDKARMVSRYGMALVQTNGGDEDGTTPEGIVGLDYERQIGATTRLVSVFELLPDLSELGEFRARADAAIEWNLDATMQWMLRLGVASDYDSTPGDADETDVDYFLSLGRRF